LRIQKKSTKEFLEKRGEKFKKYRERDQRTI